MYGSTLRFPQPRRQHQQGTSTKRLPIDLMQSEKSKLTRTHRKQGKQGIPSHHPTPYLSPPSPKGFDLCTSTSMPTTPRSPPLPLLPTCLVLLPSWNQGFIHTRR